MAEENDSKKSGGLKSLMDELPFDKLKGAAQDGLKRPRGKAMDNVTGKLSGPDRLPHQRRRRRRRDRARQARKAPRLQPRVTAP